MSAAAITDADLLKSVREHLEGISDAFAAIELIARNSDGKDGPPVAYVAHKGQQDAMRALETLSDLEPEQ